MAFKGKSMVDVKLSNRRAILNLLHNHGAISRKNVANILALTPAAITLIVNDLIADGIVHEISQPDQSLTTGPGRKEIMIDLINKSRFGLGISINLGEAVLSAVKLDGELVFEKKIKISDQTPARETIDNLCRKMKWLIEDYAIQPEAITGLGVALRGIVNNESGIGLNSYGVWQDRNVPVKQLIREQFTMPILVDNNVRSLANAHLFLTRSDDTDSMLFIRSEMGIGAALLIDHKLHYGSNFQCSEIGHIPAVANGPRCSCGKSGCLETVASVRAIVSSVKAVYSAAQTPALYKSTHGHLEEITIRNIFQSAEAGDEKLLEILTQAAGYFAAGICTAISILDPKKIVLYGTLFEEPLGMSLLNEQICQINCELSERKKIIEKSEFNLELDGKSAGILAICNYFNQGGLVQKF